MTEPRDDVPASDQPADPTRPLPQHETGSLPAWYAYPTSPPAAAPEGTALTDEPAPAGHKRTGLIIAAVAAVATLGAGGVLAYNALSGGGTQPAEVLPGDAYAYMRVDIDPAAGQKIAAVRFLNKIPQVKDFATGDPRQKLWELATKDAKDDCVKTFAYDTDIAPWLGERAAFALRPGGTADEPNAALALQVTDEDAATNALTKLFACDDGQQPDLRMKNGYALITVPGRGDDLVAAVDKGTLAANATFTADMSALGEQGVVSFWGDLQPLLKDASNLAPGSAPDAGLPIEDLKGRLAAALRFDPSYVELAGIGRGIQIPGAVQSATGGNSTALAKLPEDTMAAVHVANADQTLDTAWPQLAKQLDRFAAAEGQGDLVGLLEDQFDLSLPDDLKALFGSSFTFAMPAQDFENDIPTLGFSVVSTDAARAEEVLANVQDGIGSNLLTTTVEGDRLVVATTPDYASRLRTGGKLGDSEAFKTALGDLSTSPVAYYVDLDQLEKLYLEEVDGDARAALEAMRAVGVKGSLTGQGDSTFSLRVVGN